LSAKSHHGPVCGDRQGKGRVESILQPLPRLHRWSPRYHRMGIFHENWPDSGNRRFL